MPNVHNIITAHNRTVLDCKQPEATKNPDRKCNCRKTLVLTLDEGPSLETSSFCLIFKVVV
jgi:hypothetical protein